MTQGPGARAFRARAAALIALAAALYLPSVWSRDLWNPDEPRYAEAAREMTSRGDYILPHLNGNVYPEKPPLFFWLSIAASWIPGVPAGAGGRLVSAAASAGTLLFTWRIGAIVMGEATGALAAALAGTSLMFWQLSQTGVIDPLLTCLCAAALHGFAIHCCGRRFGMLVFYAACGLGVLAKGPVGLLIPALAAAAYALAADGPRGLRARHPLWGLPLSLLPAGVWLAAAALRGGAEYAEIMLFKQNVGRAFDAFIHKEPFYYFALVFPAAFLPWTLFLPQAIAAAWKEKIGRVRPMLFPLAWFATTFVLFSVVSGKKTRYMMPLTPAAALLVAGYLMRRHLEPGGAILRGRGALVAAAILGVLLAGALAAPAAAGSRVLPDAVMERLREPGSEAALSAVEAALRWPGALRLWLPALLLGGGSIWAARLAIAGRGEAFAALLGGWTLFLAAGGWLWAGTVNQMKSAAYLAEEIRRAAPGAQLHYIRSNHSGALNFYLSLDRIPVLHSAEEVARAGATPGARFVGTREEIARVSARGGPALREILCRRVGEDVLCLAAPAGTG